MKVHFFVPLLFLLLNRAHFSKAEEGKEKELQQRYQPDCTEPAQSKIADFGSFRLADSQFTDFWRDQGDGNRCSGLHWVNVTADSWVHGAYPNAVRLKDSSSTFICRCLHCGNGNMENQAFSGYVDANTRLKLCHVPYGSDQTVERYQVLTNPCHLQLKWVSVEDRELPHCSVVGGFEASAAQYDVKKLPPYVEGRASLSYVGRTVGPDGRFYAGKVHSIDRLIYYPYRGKQEGSGKFEVLVLKY